MPQIFTIDVWQRVEVEIDAAKLDEAFMAEFRQSFYPFHHRQEHAEHIAQIQARGVIDIEHVSEFIEGYGQSSEMGIKARVTDTTISLAGSI